MATKKKEKRPDWAPPEPDWANWPITRTVFWHMTRYEGGPELEPHEFVRLFSYLVRGGHVFALPGHYGRTAEELVGGGMLTPGGEYTEMALRLYPMLEEPWEVADETQCKTCERDIDETNYIVIKDNGSHRCQACHDRAIFD